ncbi:MAG: ATP-binding protein [Spirochaetales bacterium]|nr:ATP-binding protein [Spirochaetales bacterium]
MKQHNELKPEDLKINIDLSEEISKDYSENSWGVIGQPRAVQALEMGLSINAKGYNIFVTGESGTGRYTAVSEILKKFKEKKVPLEDVAYVFNFEKPENPRVIYFPEGEARRFRTTLDDLIDKMKQIIGEKLKSQAYTEKRDNLISETEKNENRQLREFEEQLTEADFCTIQLGDEENGDELAADLVPVHGGEPLSFDELHDLIDKEPEEGGEVVTEEYWTSKREEYFGLVDQMKGLYESLQKARRTLQENLEELQSELIGPALKHEIDMIRLEWKDEQYITYFNGLEKDILANLDIFELDEEDDEEELEEELRRYGINIIVDNSGATERPVIRETNPTKANLLGTIEARTEISGDTKTNFTMIRAGSLLKAAGGVLILRADDLIQHDNIWTELKRVIDTGQVELELPPTPLGPPTAGMKPEPVRFNTKIIMIGQERLYDILSAVDGDLRKYFKIPAEFNSWMTRSDETTREYVRFIRSFIEKYSLKEVTLDGLEEIIRYGVVLSERKDQLSTRFSLISDLIRESDYWAGQADKEKIDSKAVQRAMECRQYLYDLPEETMLEQVEKGSLLINVEGSETGSVNGLAVLERGNFFSFGCTMKITATVGAGKEGIINIEREAGLSGDIHSKGILILEGYLRNRYARNLPLSLYAGICVEQNYYEIEGDSASSTELYALLSAIAGVPLRQDLAVTGSVNQFGIIQPVGGVTEKVEGFFRICCMKGLTGEQGVILPKQNIENLLPSRELIQAIERGVFHIYPVSTIDEGMEILTGYSAGSPDFNKRKNRGTLYEMIREELVHLNKIS